MEVRSLEALGTTSLMDVKRSKGRVKGGDYCSRWLVQNEVPLVSDQDDLFEPFQL